MNEHWKVALGMVALSVVAVILGLVVSSVIAVVALLVSLVVGFVLAVAWVRPRRHQERTTPGNAECDVRG